MEANDFLAIYNDEHVANYIKEMSEWIFEQTKEVYSQEEINKKFFEKKDVIRDLFAPYRETIMSQSVEKWAEMLAVSWGLLTEPHIEFV
ncbi:hypothetical protein [Bacillus sp. NPDC094106]|uniref:hypothetical protein n=1 Tax=Bacillus sp. NPDC094106 TaxID=3363949 RepID=UPI00380E5CFC